jgi:hypothetical protein
MPLACVLAIKAKPPMSPVTPHITIGKTRCETGNAFEVGEDSTVVGIVYFNSMV